MSGGRQDEEMEAETEPASSPRSRRYESLQAVRMDSSYGPLFTSSVPDPCQFDSFCNEFNTTGFPELDDADETSYARDATAFDEPIEEVHFRGDTPSGSREAETGHSHGGAGTTAQCGDYDYLQRFMQNEMNYDEFMRLTGGQTLEEEEMAAGDMSDEEMDEEEEIDEQTEENQEEPTGAKTPEFDGVNGQRGEPPAKMKRVVDDLPMHARIIMAEVINEGNSLLDVHAANSASTKMPIPKHEPQPSTSAAADETPVDKRDRGSKRAKILDSMLGQTNMMIASSTNLEEAFELIQEVIKQDHRNAEAYRQISFIYGLKKDKAKYLQYGLLAAFLDNRTKAEDWCTWGNEALELDMRQEASACYGKAIRLDPQNWQYYEKRIEVADKMGIRPLSMRTRLQAAQMIDSQTAQVDFEFYKHILNDVASYYLMINDEERAMQALECLIIRSKEFDMEFDKHLDTLIGMLMEKRRYADTAKCIIALCQGVYCLNNEEGGRSVQIRLEHGSYTVDPYPLPVNTVIKADANLDTHFLAMLLQCIILSDRKSHCEYLLEELSTRDLDKEDMEILVLNILDAFREKKLFKSGLAFSDLLESLQFYKKSSARFWFLKGQLCLNTANEDKAMECFINCLAIDSQHVDARISLSDLQQKAGDVELALETLRDVDFDVCSQLPDERLLIRQAEMLFQGKMTEKFIRTARLLLIPHFYDVHRAEALFSKRSLSRSGHTQSYALRERLLATINGTSYEKFVKRLGADVVDQNRPPSDLTATDLHDYCIKLIEALLSVRRYNDALIICAYAYLQPKIKRTDKQVIFQTIIFFLAVKAGNWSLAFEYIRWYHANLTTAKQDLSPVIRETIFKKVFNAMNFVFSNSQNVIYHRYIMRALAKNTGNHALHCISGNNSLVTGSYKHALGEYLRVYDMNQKNPMICLLVGLTFIHMSCKKDLSSKHLLAVKGLAFVKKYERMRTLKQECYYNIGRMFHQMGIIHMAVHYYEKALNEPVPLVETIDEEGNSMTALLEKYDVRKFAAHNLAQIYNASGNRVMARQIYERYLVIE